jgi:hypothetical protein
MPNRLLFLTKLAMIQGAMVWVLCMGVVGLIWVIVLDILGDDHALPHDNRQESSLLEHHDGEEPHERSSRQSRIAA